MSGPIDYMDMSDEDFAKIDMPTSLSIEDTTEAGGQDAENGVQDDSAAADGSEVGDGGVGSVGDSDAGDGLVDGQDGNDGESDPNEAGQADAAKAADAGEKGESRADGQGTPKGTAPTEPLNYEELYKQIMAPFRANGREFTPSSPEEAVRLMQMGANYTKKMQALAPNLKLLRMLENNQLLQEDKIAFLIDLEKKDPKAIQKLLHDGKVDPLGIDTEAAPTYQPGNHKVSDADMAFEEVLEGVMQTSTGRETVKTINDEWDQVSKQEIFKEPRLLSIIDQQRSNGIYAKIAGEIERRRILGELSNVPFIQAYKTVGDELHAQGKLAVTNASAGQPNPVVPQQPQAVGTRPARARMPNASRDQVRAVSAAPGNSPKSAKADFDPLAMSDAEILAMEPPR